MELVKNDDIDIQYHPRKTNMVANALSRKTTHSSTLITSEVRVQKDFERANIVIVTEGDINIARSSHLGEGNIKFECDVLLKTWCRASHLKKKNMSLKKHNVVEDLESL